MKMGAPPQAYSTFPTFDIHIYKQSLSHLFRHASEITRETKGGYLHGKIQLDENLLSGAIYLRMSLVPTEVDSEHNPFHLHPNLMHINMRLNKKARNLRDGELPDDVDWHIIFRVLPDGNVERVCPSVNPNTRTARFRKNPALHQTTSDTHEDHKRRSLSAAQLKSSKQNLCLGPLNLPKDCTYHKVTNIHDGNIIDLGTNGLMLNIITPLQKFSKGGATITDVIKQRFYDLFGTNISQSSLEEVEKIFTENKEKRIRLQKVKLIVEAFQEQTHQFLASCQSDTVINSKSKECGPLHLYDVNPPSSCCAGGTKVFLLSSFKLVSDIKALFILYNSSTQKIVNFDQIFNDGTNIEQPTDSTVFNQCVVIFTAPAQKYYVIKKIAEENLELRIAAYRPSDGRVSANSFIFKYYEHKDLCSTCDLLKPKPDVHEQVLPTAKPGVQRRLYDETTTNLSSSALSQIGVKQTSTADVEQIIDDPPRSQFGSFQDDPMAKGMGPLQVNRMNKRMGALQEDILAKRSRMIQDDPMAKRSRMFQDDPMAKRARLEMLIPQLPVRPPVNRMNSDKELEIDLKKPEEIVSVKVEVREDDDPLPASLSEPIMKLKEEDLNTPVPEILTPNVASSPPRQATPTVRTPTGGGSTLRMATPTGGGTRRKNNVVHQHIQAELVHNLELERSHGGSARDTEEHVTLPIPPRQNGDPMTPTKLLVTLQPRLQRALEVMNKATTHRFLGQPMIQMPMTSKQNN